VQEVHVQDVPLEMLASQQAPGRAEELRARARRAVALLGDRTVWNISSTAHGGGVAEMLQTVLAYGRGAGVDTRWLVIEGAPEFFTVTKRIHNLLHGSPGDEGPLGPAEREVYQAVLDADFPAIAELVRPGDVVLLHDPQTAGLVDGIRSLGAIPVWRCHIGRDGHNPSTSRGWTFLRDLVSGAEGFVFSRASYAPDFVGPERLTVIAPSLDPFSTKNQPIDDADVLAVLRRASLVADGITVPDPVGPRFVRRDGSVGTVRPHTGLVVDDEPVPEEARLVLQVSRWDRLKDMGGLLAGVAERLDRLPDDVHLLLVGPDVAGVDDDPEGAEVLQECRDFRAELPAATRGRVHLAQLPMDDGDENAVLVNALQRHAAVVVQKSLEEGFGLTVTEPMWKARPVVASAVGGIRDQIVDGESGLLLADPRDPDELVGALTRLLDDPAYAGRLGAAARERVRERFLPDRHLVQYGELFDRVVRP
jgi:trehalose synthase